MNKISLRGLAAHKRRLAATCSAVLLGIAFLAGTLVLGDSLRAGFGETFTQAHAGTDAVVRGTTTIDHGELSQRRPLDPSLLDELRQLDGVARAQPTIDGTAQLTGADGTPIGGDGPPTLATNWIDDAELNPFRIAEGRAPEATGEVVIDRASAKAGDLAVGDTTVVRTPESTGVRIVGIAAFGEADGIGAGFTFFTLDDARDHLLAGAELSTVLLAGEPGVSPAALLEQVRPLLGNGVEALSGAALAAEQTEDINGDFLDIFETFLLAFTGIALLVATFSIYNTFSVILAQRSQESALLRALGASRRQVLGSIAVEACVVGVLASGFGVLAGIGLAVGLQALMDAAGFGLPTSELVIGVDSVVISVVIGLAVTLVASLAPAIRASRVAPLAALREVAVDHSGASRVRAIAGGITLAAGVALVLGPALAGTPSLGLVGLGALATIVGVVVLGPVAARHAAGLLASPLAALRGVSGPLAGQNARRDPKRTASTASALMVGVAVVTLFTVFGASIKSTIGDSLASTFTGDLVITTSATAPLEPDSSSGAGLAPELAREIAELPGVETAAGLGYGAARIGGQDGAFSVAEPTLLARVLDLDVSAGSLERLGEGELGVSQATAEEKGWQLGTRVPIDFPDGTSTELAVDAIYETTDNVGPFLMPASVWAPHATQPADTAVLIDVAAGADVADVRAAVTQVAEDFGTPAVQDRREYIATVAGGVDQLLTVVYVLLALSIVIALMSITNTLSLSIHERTRELGLLRAVGQTRGQLRAMIRWESVLIAVFATLGGVGLGLFLGWGLVRVATAEAGFGSFALPASQLGVVLVVGTLVGVLAGLRPARRAARLDVLAAIDSE